ncbi:MAG: DUF2231 domain-containing protein [Bacillota bacterium]|nr:DUF2231 domain-containing protein [Bacillota bacterium]
MFTEVFSHIHPIMVHFPIAIIFIATIYDLIMAITKRKFSPKKGLWLWVLAFLSAWVAVLTGPDEDARGNTNIFHTHENLAHITTILSLLVLAVRIFFMVKKKDFLRFSLVIYCVVSLICLGGVLATGYYGGKMVYDQGVGVKMSGKYVNPPKQGKFDQGD